MLEVPAFTFNPVLENTYLLVNGRREAAVIDPGCYGEEEQQALADFLSQNGLVPKLLFNTHCHLDHVFGNRWVGETYNLPLHIHPLEKAVLDLAPAFGLQWGLPFDNYDGEVIYVDPSKPLIFGEERLELLWTPGHSPGHLCLYSPAHGILIGGDVLFRESIGRTDLPGGDHAQLLRSIQEQLWALPDETVVYPGHGPETTIGHEKKYNPFVGG